MPAYDYHCSACDKTFEVEQSIKDAPLKKCALCGAASVKRLISCGTTFQLKGDGWYRDGYASKGNPKNE